MPTTYSAFRPTQFDNHITLPDREDWLVAPVSRNRDSGVLTESNWEAQLATLDHVGAEYEIHRWGHWGPGWFEICLIHPDHAQVVEELEASLMDYPILDESDYCNREHEAVQKHWNHMRLKDRIELCKECEVSIFTARRDDVFNEPVMGELYNRIAYWINEG